MTHAEKVQEVMDIISYCNPGQNHPAFMDTAYGDHIMGIDETELQSVAEEIVTLLELSKND